MRAYEMVKLYYGTMRARRSGVPLIRHIDQGLAVLEHLGALEVVRGAYCLHPLLQADTSLKDFWERGDHISLPPAQILLAMEYRSRANSWLSDSVSLRDMAGGQVVDFSGLPDPGPLNEVKLMLIADKVQNYKDFLRYHQATHLRSRELTEYFHRWLSVLGVSTQLFEELCVAMDSVKDE